MSPAGIKSRKTPETLHYWLFKQLKLTIVA